MAVSSTAATVYISSRKFPIPTTRKGAFFSNFITSTARPRRFLIRSSSDGSAETAAKEVEELETSIEAPEGPTSLISALNVERALRGIPITDVDYYGRLGIDRECSYEEVTVAYKNKVEELLNQGLDEEDVRQKMEQLKESYSILSSEEERRMYDWSLARSETPERYTWPFQTDKLKPPTEPPPPQEPEDVGPTRLVGYFILGWILLSFVLSIVLSR
ncbi:NAD(P)H-quinone oxidoreductase subunit U, chloroplastic [Manihot esculenta]|uniref:J domain-containing protein n=1 Tax=Manihot esculenta TaxID=3983 RepID=A0A2C9U9R5_MANES|nr:NAD(P)H-quinone oxidoreductase subunit U, chloroplastic [Manihot esculenta]OAY26919.1 hypothetical protein MANES_16G084900v8 [Manihot esculenta]